MISIATLHLIINYSSAGSQSLRLPVTATSGMEIRILPGGDKTYLFPSGNASGCDSTATLHLKINYSSTSGSSATSCDSYIWNNSTYTSSGDKTQLLSLANATGCDSTITLHLTINNSSSGEQSYTACDSYIWNGSTYTTGGNKTYLFAAGNTAGCDSTATFAFND